MNIYIVWQSENNAAYMVNVFQYRENAEYYLTSMDHRDTYWIKESKFADHGWENDNGC